MPRFIVNKNPQDNGDHEVHNTTDGCSHMPNPENQIDLEFHASCREAVRFAQVKWPQNRINGCYYCCNDCHTS